MGRPPVQRTRIINDLRERIVTGKVAAGGRLPALREVAREFNTSLITVQQALHRLAKDGFVESRGPLGTFVSAHPPHLSRYAIIFPMPPGVPAENRFWTALANESTRSSDDPSHCLEVFFGIDGHSDSPGYRQLLRDLKHRRLAGLIFAYPPMPLARTPLVLEPGIPRVGLMSPSPAFPGFTAINLEFPSFTRQALQYLTAAHRRRIAVLTIPGRHAEWQGVLNRHTSIETRPYWVQSVHPASPRSARQVVHLLMQADQPVRPDGLIITDDNLVEAATAGLLDANVSVPTDLSVVVHCNFPWPTLSHVPARRLGYDVHRVLEVCLSDIERQRTGGAPRSIGIPAVWEDEL